jgi:hypothetical protein
MATKDPHDMGIVINGKTVMHNLGLSLFPDKHQLRFRSTFYAKDGSEKPVDIVVDHYSEPVWNLTTVETSCEGFDVKTGTIFKLKISVNILKRDIILKGSIGSSSIDKKFKSIDKNSIHQLVEFISNQFNS